MSGIINPPGAGGGGSVTSVFGRTGVVASQQNDYNTSQIAGMGGAQSAFIKAPSSTQTLVGGSAINPVGSQLLAISANTAISVGSVTIAGAVAGQICELVNFGTNAITIPTAATGILIANAITIASRETLALQYRADLSVWVPCGGSVPQTRGVTQPWNDDSTALATTGQIYDHLYDHDQPGWRVAGGVLPALANGWTAFGAQFGSLAVKRVGRDMVFMRGLLVTPTTFAGAILSGAGLPADVRPAVDVQWDSIWYDVSSPSTSWGSGVLRVSSAGVVTYVPISGTPPGGRVVSVVGSWAL